MILSHGGQLFEAKVGVDVQTAQTSAPPEPMLLRRLTDVRDDPAIATGK